MIKFDLIITGKLNPFKDKYIFFLKLNCIMYPVNCYQTKAFDILETQQKDTKKSVYNFSHVYIQKVFILIKEYKGIS